MKQNDVDLKFIEGLMERITVALETMADQREKKSNRNSQLRINRESLALAFVAKTRITDSEVIARHVKVTSRTVRRWKILQQLIATMKSDEMPRQTRRGFRKAGGDVEAIADDES